MIAADGGGGGGTDWSSMSMDDMRALIKTPDLSTYSQALLGWQKSSDLLYAHGRQVKAYRDALALAWPPEKSAASEVYLTRLDEMLANLDQTREASIANYGAFNDVSMSLAQARTDFEQIDREYTANEAAVAAYHANASTGDASPYPIASDRQQTLTRQAAARLSSVSTDLAQAQAQLRHPDLYVPRTGRDDSNTPISGEIYSPPALPAITPSYGGSSASRNGSTHSPVSGHAGTVPSARPIESSSSSGRTIIHSGGPGVILGSVGTPSLPHPASGNSVLLPGSGGGANGTVVNPAPPPTVLPSGGKVRLPGGATTGGVTYPSSPAPGSAFPDEPGVRSTGISPGPRVMPAGAVIGGSSGSGLGRSESGQPGMRRVNPVGGVIGEVPPSGDPSTRRMSPYGGEAMTPGGGGIGQAGMGGKRGSASNGPRYGSTGGSNSDLESPGRGRAGGYSATEASGGQAFGRAPQRRSRREDRDESLHWDPDNPWETAEGVDPVLRPAPEQRIDPGPAIGLR